MGKRIQCETRNEIRWVVRAARERFGTTYALAVFFLLALVGCGQGDTSGGGGIEAFVEDSRLVDDEPNTGDQWVSAPNSPGATACSANNQCPTGFCVDGFCCDAKCDYPCMACSASKKGSGVDGVCGSIAYDTDPDNDCPVGACDGKNQCKNYNGVACSSASSCLSNYCVDGTCCGNICMGSCQACSAAKKGSGYDGACGSIKAATDPDNECNPGECNGSGACNASPQPLSANGAACTSAAQCQSGYCADGVCCDSWCLGTCMACSAAKKGGGADGTCGFVADDKDFDDECWAGACNGAGVCKQYNGLPCTDKSQCLSNYCVDGVCCGNICNQFCTACTTAKKGYGYDGVCEPIASGRDLENECNPGECNGSAACNQPQTPQANGTACVSAGQCASGNCVDNVCCDTACSGSCTACTAAKKGSGVDGTCGNIKAETDPDKECGVSGRCGGSGVCRYYNGAPCTSTAQCFSNYCVDGVCCGNVCTNSCMACSYAKKGYGYDGVCQNIAGGGDPDNECNPGECSGSGACNQPQVLLTNGSACASGVQCSSGNCVDGVCCDTACTGACQACTATKKGSGTNGACGNIKYDTDPDNECLNGACSGTGTCKSYNGMTCSTTAECLSNYCVDGFCCGNICTNTCMACSAAKKGGGTDGVCAPIAQWSNPDAECPGGTCNGSGACMSLLGNGSVCSSNAQCTSDHCVDGVCCDNACTGACLACNLAGSIGTCSTEPPGVCTTCTGLVGLPGVPVSSIALGVKAIADLNADGAADAISFGYGYDNMGTYVYYPHVYVYLANGDGTFGPQRTYYVGDGLYSMWPADLTGDGKLDLVFRRYTWNGTGGLSVLLNNGNGGFGNNADYNVAMKTFTIADLTGDGMLDLAVVDNNSMKVLPNNGSGTFSTVGPSAFNGCGDPNSIIAADLNGDSKADLAIANSSFAHVCLHFNQGGGVWNTGPTLSLGSVGGLFQATDLNGDGRLDLATGHNASIPSVSVLLNNGNGTFASYVNYSPGQMLADVTGDGKADIISSDITANTVSVRLNQGDATFAPKADYATGNAPRMVRPADMNGDGKLDIATVSKTDDAVGVLLNQGNGTFAPQTVYVGLFSPEGAEVADVDNDGKVDLVVHHSGNIAPLLNDGNGYFGPTRVKFPTGSGPWSTAAADFNGDGLSDIATVNLIGGSISVLLNQGNQNFGTKVDYPANSSPSSIHAADLNVDGAVDLVIGYNTGSLVSVFLNQGNGTFGSKVDYAVGSSPKNVTAADVNGDGVHDLVTSNYGSNSLTVRLNIGNGTFAAATDYPTSLQPLDVVAADLNNDAHIDLAVANSGTNSVNVFYNQGNGVFAAKVDFALGSPGLTVVAEDLNADGKKDLALGGGANVQVLLNQGDGSFVSQGIFPTNASIYALAVADLDGDAAPDLAMALGYEVGWLRNLGNGAFGPDAHYAAGAGTYSIAPADFNGDGKIDFAAGEYDGGRVSVLFNRCIP